VTGAASGDASPSGRIRSLALDALPGLVVGAAFVHALVAGWRKWGDLTADTGRELDLPRRLAEGQLLYRDARFYYGPLAPYLNALLYRLFGVHLDVLVWAGIASAALLCIALYRLARFFVPRWGAAAVSVAFLYLCAFAQLYVGGTFNFVLPYTFAATYGILAATWSLVFLIEHLRTQRRERFFLSVACLVLAALSKVEAFAPALAAHSVFLAAMLVARSRLRRTYLAGYGVAAAAVGGVWGALAVAVGPSLWTENVAGVVNRGSRRFVLWAMGFADPAASLRAMGLSAALLVAVMLLSFLVSRMLSRRSLPGPAAWGLATAVGLATLFAYRYWQLHVHFRVLPVAMTVAVTVLAVLYAKQPGRRREWLGHALVWVFGLACLGRIVLASRPQHYGFYLLPAGLVCVGLLFFDYGPRLSGSGVWPARVFGAAGIGLLAASASLAFADSQRLFALHTYELDVPRGRLWIVNRWGLEGPAVHALSRLPPETRLATVPEGAGLLFFSGLREADSMFSYLPMEVVGPAGDDALLRRWKANPPDVIAWIGRPMAEFGSAGFGVDYARRSMSWVREEYEPATDPAAAIVLLLRRSVAAGIGPVALRPSAGPPGARADIVGTVLESFDESGATFLHLGTDGGRVWVGVPEARVSVGSRVTVSHAQPSAVREFGLRRRIDPFFVGRLVSPSSTSPARGAE
jgi:hypothetical protein